MFEFLLIYMSSSAVEGKWPLIVQISPKLSKNMQKNWQKFLKMTQNVHMVPCWVIFANFWYILGHYGPFWVIIGYCEQF